MWVSGSGGLLRWIGRVKVSSAGGNSSPSLSSSWAHGSMVGVSRSAHGSMSPRVCWWMKCDGGGALYPILFLTVDGCEPCHK